MLPGMDEVTRRLERLEEGLMFAEHAADARADDARQVFERLGEIERRLAALEGRLAAAANPSPEPDSPFDAEGDGSAR